MSLNRFQRVTENPINIRDTSECECAKYSFRCVQKGNTDIQHNTCRQNLAHHFINLKIKTYTNWGWRERAYSHRERTNDTRSIKIFKLCTRNVRCAPFNSCARMCFCASVFVCVRPYHIGAIGEADVANVPIKHLYSSVREMRMRWNSNGHCRRCLLNFIFFFSSLVCIK